MSGEAAVLTAADVAWASPTGGAEPTSAIGLPTCVPPVAQLPVLTGVSWDGLQRKNVMLPVGVGGLLVPAPCTVARSVTDTPGATDVAEGVVVSVAVQLANCPITKSFSVAVVEVEERDSAAMLEKHSPPARAATG